MDDLIKKVPPFVGTTIMEESVRRLYKKGMEHKAEVYRKLCEKNVPIPTPLVRPYDDVMKCVYRLHDVALEQKQNRERKWAEQMKRTKIQHALRKPTSSGGASSLHKGPQLFYESLAREKAKEERLQRLYL